MPRAGLVFGNLFCRRGSIYPALAALIATIVGAGCGASAQGGQAPSAPVEPPIGASPAHPELPDIEPPALPRPEPVAPTEPTTELLAVEGFEPAVLVVPPGAGKHPVMVATHGAWDRPEPHCALWGSMVGRQGFVLCPRGRRAGTIVADDQQPYYYPTHFWIEREIKASLEALRQRHGEQMDEASMVYAGFSQGAIMGGLVVARAARSFPRAILVEGTYGLGQWDGGLAQLYRRGGGERVLFACGGWYCADRGRASALAAQRAGVQARVAVGSGGHTIYGGVARALAADLPWLLEGDDRWSP